MKQRYFFLSLPIFVLLGWWLWPHSQSQSSLQPPSEEPAISSPDARPAPKQVSKPSEHSERLPTRPPQKKTQHSLAKDQARPLNPEEIAQARSEIKITLAAIYAGQKSFHSEYGRYSTDLFRGIGFMPEGKERWSKVGFLQPHSPRKLAEAEDPRYLDIDAYTNDPEIVPEQRPAYRNQGEKLSLADLSSHCRQGCTADQHGFEVMAAVTLVPGEPPEVWLINDKKELRQVQDGLASTSNAPPK